MHSCIRTKKGPQHVERQDDDRCKRMGDAVRLKPNVQHQIEETVVRNRMKAHDDEGCLAKKIQKTRRRAEMLLSVLAGKKDQVRGDYRKREADDPMREGAIDDPDADAVIDADSPEGN